MVTETKVEKVKAFWWLSGITIGYFAIYYLLIAETQACAGVPIQSHWFYGFWDRYLGCRSVNELGDALAGAFAPVAFLWLAGAVFIQSKELEAQREELNETQEVMREQVDEMRASTALLRLQTEAIQKDQARKDQELADKEFDERVELTETVFRDLQSIHLAQLGSEPEGMHHWKQPSLETTLFEFTPVDQPTFDELMTRIAENAHTIMNYVKRTPLPEGFFWEWSPSYAATSIHTGLNILNNESAGISPGHELKRLRRGIPAAQAAFEKLQALIEDTNKAAGKITE